MDEGESDGKVLFTFLYFDIFFGKIGVTPADVFQPGLGRIQYLALALEVVADDQVQMLIDKYFDK